MEVVLEAKRRLVYRHEDAEKRRTTGRVKGAFPEKLTRILNQILPFEENRRHEMQCSVNRKHPAGDGQKTVEGDGHARVEPGVYG